MNENETKAAPIVPPTSASGCSAVRVPKWAKDAAKEYVGRLWSPEGRRVFLAREWRVLAKLIATHHKAATDRNPNPSDETLRK